MWYKWFLFLICEKCTPAIGSMDCLHHSQNSKGNHFSTICECSAKMYIFHKARITYKIEMYIFHIFEKRPKNSRRGWQITNCAKLPKILMKPYCYRQYYHIAPCLTVAPYLIIAPSLTLDKWIKRIIMKEQFSKNIRRNIMLHPV